VLALIAVIVLVPLLYLPGYLIAQALLGAAQPRDLLERHYERVVAGALLNGWLAFTLAELGLFSAWLHVLLLLAVCGACAAVALRRGALRLPQSPLGIVAYSRPTTNDQRPTTNDQWSSTKRQGDKETRRRRNRNSTLNTQHSKLLLHPLSSILGAHWDVLGFTVVGLVFVLLVARPFEVVLGVRDAGVYANVGFAIARTGGIVQYDPLVAQIGQDQESPDADLRRAAEQAETNFLGVQSPERSIATRLRAAGFYISEGDLQGGRVVPQFFHLFPAWIALLTAFLGLHGGLLATGLLGFLGLWSVGMLGRRLAGPWVGLLAILFLALNGVQVWFSRYSTAEATAQFLTFAGLYGFAVMHSDRPTTNDQRPTTNDRSGDKGTRRQGDSETETQHSTLNTQNSSSILDRAVGGRGGFAALVAGVAFGQVALARIDFVLVVAPIVGYLFYIWLTRRWARLHTLLAVGLGAMLLHAALHVVFIARAYFFDTLYARLQDYALTALLTLPFLTPTLRTYYLSIQRSAIGIRRGPGLYDWNIRRIAVEAAIVALALVCIFALRRWGQPLIARGERAVKRWAEPLLLLSALGIVALAAYAYLIRPQILTFQTLAALPGCLSQLGRADAACLRLQGYIGAPIVAPGDNRAVYTIPLANLVRVGWYLSPLGIALGVAGFALWWRRGMNRSSWLFLTVGLLATIFFVRQSYGTSDQSYIYILRRYVPQIYPVLCLGIAYALVALARWTRQAPRMEDGGWRMADGRAPVLGGWSLVVGRWSLVGVVGLGLALAGFLALTDMGIYRHVEYGGALAQLQAIAERFGPRDVLLFHSGSRDEPDLVVTPLKYAFGLDAFTIKSTSPERYAPQLARYIQRWREQGRTVYLVFGASGGMGLPGFQLHPAGRLGLQHLDEFEQLTDQKPHNVADFNADFAVYRLDTAAPPSAAPASVTPDDYAAQVSGFYHHEQIDGMAFAWTQGDALLRLPWPQDGAPRRVTIRLAGGRRPASVQPGRACLEFWPETNFRFEAPATIGGSLGCLDLQQQMTDYTLTLDPRAYPAVAASALLLHIHSDTWVPAKADRALVDRRALGVQFGGLSIRDTMTR
jgi:hypothetical protein